MLCWRYAALHLHLTKRLKQRAGCFILSLRNEMPDVTKLPEIRNPSDSWKFPGNVLKLIYFYLLTDGKMVITMKVWLLTSLFYLFPVLILLSAFMKDVDMWLPPSLSHHSLTHQRKWPCLVEELKQAGGNLPALSALSGTGWVLIIILFTSIASFALMFYSLPHDL